MRRKFTIDETLSNFCKCNSLLSTSQYELLKICLIEYSSKFSSRTKFYQYIKNFIKYNLKFWRQRLLRLSSMNLRGVRKKKLILLYGKHEALKRWDNYIKLQTITNTFQYKNDKYGWTEDQFKEYNKDRSVTLNNLIRRHGLQIGENKYNEYVEKQRFSGCSEDYFKQKYGEIDGKIKFLEINKKKVNNLKNFILRYGNILGKVKYTEYINNRSKYYSKSSQDLFWKIKTPNCYFEEYNKEFGVLGETQYYFYDFVDTDLKKCIEYNGDYWHCNPMLYNEDYITHYGITAKDIWLKDENKINMIKSLGYDIKIVWESEYLLDSNSIINECVEFLNG